MGWWITSLVDAALILRVSNCNSADEVPPPLFSQMFEQGSYLFGSGVPATVSIRMNNGCAFVAQNSDGAQTPPSLPALPLPHFCFEGFEGHFTFLLRKGTVTYCPSAGMAAKRATHLHKEESCGSDPNDFSHKDVSEWLLSDAGLANDVVDKSFTSHSIDGGFMRGMVRAGREPGAAEADLRELGVSSVSQSKIVGKWMNLLDDDFAS
jgi:hypothetical protein